MRITSGMMINNALFNLTKNKKLVDTLNTQLATTKKIQRPSEDPIIAIRALRLRSTYNEVEQYLKKNIPDARAWMTTTQEAIDSVNEVLVEISGYCNQGVNDYNTVAERETLVASLKELRNQIYADGDADYAGRTVFTGYKTDSTLTFQEDEPDTEYTINETFDFKDVNNEKKIVGLDISTTEYVAGSAITNEELHVINLAYRDLSTSAPTVSVNGTAVAVQVKSRENLGDMVYNVVPGNGAVYIPETGELLIGNNIYDDMASEAATIDISYKKEGFNKGDLRPEHYFDCKNETKGVSYTEKDQAINYTINFNQTIKINSQGKDILTHDIGRDLDIIIDSVSRAVEAQDKIAEIEGLMTLTEDETELAKLESMLDVAKLELTYAEENMSEAFSEGITHFADHQNTLNVELSDLGARLQRLSLNEERLNDHMLNVEEQKSENEEINQETVTVEFIAAQNVYDASLAASAKVVQKSLLDFL